MIGKFVLGSGFRGCIRYCLEDKLLKASASNAALPMLNRADVLMYNMCFGSKKELIKQFTDVRKLNRQQNSPVLHLTLSMAEGELLDRSQLLGLIDDCAKELGFSENQFLAIEHLDTAPRFQHLHIVANRIGFNGKTNVSDSNSYKRMADFCRKMEIKLGLQQVLSPRAFLPSDQKEIPRNDRRKDGIKSTLQKLLKESKTMEDFSKAAKVQGIQVVKSRGISFVDDKGVKVKGSEIGMSLQVIEKQLTKNNQTVKPETRFVNISQHKRGLRL